MSLSFLSTACLHLSRYINHICECKVTLCVTELQTHKEFDFFLKKKRRQISNSNLFNKSKNAAHGTHDLAAFCSVSTHLPGSCIS